jgi:hypothetical protein
VEQKTVWVVRWFNQGDWYEAFTSEELAEDHAWKIIGSLTDDPDDLPDDLDEARDEVESDAELEIGEVTIHDGPLPAARCGEDD